MPTDIELDRAAIEVVRKFKEGFELLVKLSEASPARSIPVWRLMETKVEEWKALLHVALTPDN